MKTKHQQKRLSLKKKKSEGAVKNTTGIISAERRQVTSKDSKQKLSSLSNAKPIWNKNPAKHLPLDPQKLRAIFNAAKKSAGTIPVNLRNANKITGNAYNEKASVLSKRGNMFLPVDQKHIQKKENISVRKVIDPYSSETVEQKAKSRLCSAKFRFLNEKLYTSTGAEALTYFQDDPESFQVYHSGFQQQVEKWPVNPLDVIIEELKEVSPDLVIADFGCGDAKIARCFPERTVHSFDLVTLNKYVTVCDMTKVPLATGSVDICIFCLSLMGTNMVDYIKEASRVLQLGGVLKLAEVKSRFEDQESFKNIMKSLGFRLKVEDWTNTMFTRMEFKKKRHVLKKINIQNFHLSPCLYKKR